MGTLIQVFLLALAVGLASSFLTSSPDFSGAADEAGACSSECTDGIANGDVSFVENRKYGYEFTGKTVITVPTGTEEGVKGVSVNGVVNVIGVKKCGAVLYLKNVVITQGSKTYSNAKLEGYPILFSYNNGKVGQNICSSAKDTDDSLNLKRAILSAFQVSSVQSENMLFETDIQGTCNTSYTSSSSGTRRTVLKVKNLAQCTGYEKINLLGMSSSQATPVYQDSPFLSADQSSEIQIIESTLKSVASQEVFLYQPFGSKDKVTQIMVSMSLDLKKRSSVRPTSFNLDKSRSIVFEKPTPNVGTASSDDLLQAMQTTMANLEPVVNMDGAKNFADLTALLKVAKMDDILSAFQEIKNGNRFDDTEVAVQVFIDALMAANSGDSIGAAAKIIEGHEISDSLTVSWFNNLANANHPTKEAIVSASGLLDKKVLKDGYLGVGSLLRQYLKDTQNYNSPEVETTLKNLGGPLKNAGETSLSPEDEDIVIASLKGIGNAHYVNSDLEDLIIQLIMNKAAVQRVRAAALNMVKSYAMNPKVEKACESIFMDISEDSELRILAFKVFAINPSNYKATVIKNMLNDKNCQIQIRAFLSSYLNNLKTTVDENKLDQKRFYGNIKSTSSKKMINDILRYSQNLEYSHQCPLLHSGVLLNGDVVYSYKSFLARSSSASLRALLFGREHDIFEFDVRVENIEPMLEKLFGPEGYLTKSNGPVSDDVKNYVSQAVNYAKSRGLNNVDSDLSAEKVCENVSGEEMNKMYLDIAIKAFGNDLGWFAFQGNECQVTYQHIIDAIVKNIHSSVPEKENIELNVRKQIPIIDYDKKYATCSGLPVSLNVQATSAMKLNVASKFDIKSYISHPENSNFKLKFVPSGSITLDTSLTVDGYAVEAGYKITSSVHTSMGSDFSLTTVEGRGFEVTYELPLDVIDILSMKAEAFGTVQEKDSPIIEMPLTTTGVESQAYTRTFDKLKDSVGLAFQTQFNFPWSGEFQSLHPFSGPSSFSFKVLKLDEKLTKYVLKGTYDLKSPMLKYVKFMFVTPKSEIVRGVELFAAYDTHSDATFVTEFRTPSSKIVLQSTLVDKDDQKFIIVKYTDGSEYDFILGTKSEDVDSETTIYSPKFEVLYSEKVNKNKNNRKLDTIFDTEGSVLVKRNTDPQISYPSKVTLKDLAFVTPESKHSLEGSLTYEDNELKGDSSLTTGRVTVNMNGFISGNRPIYKIGGELNMITNDESVEKSLMADGSDGFDDEPISKFATSLQKIKNLKMSTFQELHIESPYAFVTNNHILWDNDHFELNGHFLIENKELTMKGNMSTSNLLDSALNVNMEISPSTSSRGIVAVGTLQHAYVSDPSNTEGHANIKFVLDKDKEGSDFEFNSECPQLFGKFLLNSQHRLTNELFMYNLNFDDRYGNVLKVNLNAATDDVMFNANFDSPNPKYKSSMNVRGWSEKENSYLLDTKVLWPGTQDSNHFYANGKILLNGLQSHMNGNVDFPLIKLKNVQVTLNSEPNPKVQDGGVATVRCVSNEKSLFSEKFKYKLTQNNGELYLSGESVEEESQNLIPINFVLQLKNKDKNSKTNKELSYILSLDHNGKKRTYQKSIQVTDHTFVYRQVNTVDDDEQNVSMQLEHNIIDAWNWNYRLRAKVVSPSAFHYLIRDDHNLLEFSSYAKFGDYSLDQGHTLKIYTSEDLADSYEFRWLINSEKTAMKAVYGQREVRGLGHYSLKSIDGGYHLTSSGQLWLDHNADPNAESTLSLNAYYSLNDYLSTATDISIYAPSFNDKEMGVKTDLHMFKSWENPLSARLELNIFPTTEQKLQFQTVLKRNIQDEGTLYSGELQAKSDGMDLNYSVKNSLFVSSQKWGQYMDAYFIDSDNVKRPIQLHFEVVPRGFVNKMNVFDIIMIDVNSSIKVKDGVLDVRSAIDYNDHPYTFGLLLNPTPSLKFTMGWKDKTGSSEQLMLEGSVTMDDSAVISATRIRNNGEDVVPVGFIKKSLTPDKWWDTDNQMITDQWNSIWQSLKGELMGRFINVHSNLKNIALITKTERRVRSREAKRAKLQLNTLKEYIHDGYNQISEEMSNDEYIPEIPYLILNTTEVVCIITVDFIEHIKLTDSFKSLGRNIDNYLKDLYKNYLEQRGLFLNNLERGYKELLEKVEQSLLQIFNTLNKYPQNQVDGESSEPHNLKEYINDITNKLVKTIKKLKNSMDTIQNITTNYVQNLPIYDVMQDQIEKLKSYPYKEKLSEEIHNYLHDLEVTAPTKDFASFINSLDVYINNVIHGLPVEPRDIINLRNKGLIVAKSMIFDFSDYVDYDKAMTVYKALLKLTNLAKTVVSVVSPNTFQPQSDGHVMLYEFGELMQFYHKYLHPSNLLPPYDGQGVVVASNNIITYNDQPYSFMPNTGSYVLAKDYVNDKFSILANYNDNVLTSVTMSINNGGTYELLSGGTMTANGKNVGFPLINDDVKTWKDVYFFGIDAAVGVSVKCSTELDIVEVFVNGYYFGKVRGLMGSMYQEPTFDFKLPNGEPSNDMKSFVLAYRNAGNNRPTIVSSVPKDQSLCSRMYSGVSTMRPAFPTVSPSPYRAICNRMVSSESSQQEGLDKACLVAKAYVRMARQNFVPNTNIPEVCVTTIVQGRTLNANSNIQISDASDAADVMILFEESAESKVPVSDVIKPFTENIIKNFNQKGISDVEFIVVGYSGTGSDVHIYTANQNNNYDGLLDNAPNWSSSQTTDIEPQKELSTQIVQSYNTFVGQNSKDKAYKLSADYPFRANAIKVVVSASQNLHPQNSLDLPTLTFNYVKSSYLEQGIEFYLVAPINLHASSDEGVFGASGTDTVYSMSSPKGKQSNDEFSYDQSLETNLALNTNGAIYDSQIFVDGPDNRKNIFLRSLCQTVVKTAVNNLTVEKNCVNKVHDGVTPYVRCVVMTTNLQ